MSNEQYYTTTGGFLGGGGATHPGPWNSFTYVIENDYAYYCMDRQQILKPKLLKLLLVAFLKLFYDL